MTSVHKHELDDVMDKKTAKMGSFRAEKNNVDKVIGCTLGFDAHIFRTGKKKMGNKNKH